MGRPDRRSRSGPRFTAWLDPPSAADRGRGWFRQTPLMGMVVLLVLILVAIYSLQRAAGGDRPAVLITPFQAASADPPEGVAEELTDRLATRISRLPEVRIVLLASRPREGPGADLQLTGSVLREGEEYLVRVTLRRLPDGEHRELLVRRIPRAGLEGVVEQVADRLASDLRKGTP